MYAREAGQADATCRERYAYNPAGMNGKPSSAPLDSPLFGQIDEAGDGTFERSFYLIQNTLGDVIKIVEGAGGTQHEEIRYTLYGEPYIVNWLADMNQDGRVDGDDLVTFFALWDVGAFGSDTNGDGGVDGDDVIQFLAWWDNGEGAGRTTADNRFGFRGYVWDDRLQMYHVRHRVYDPMPGPAGLRWLQRDPAFFVDGLNLYAYCGGDPVNGVDPLGLGPWDAIKETVAGLGYATGWFQPSVPQPWTDSAPMSDPSDHYQQAERLQRIRALRDEGAKLSDEQIATIREAYEAHLESTHGDQQAQLDHLSENPTARDRSLDAGHSKRVWDKTLREAKDGTITVGLEYATAGFGAGGCSDEIFAAAAGPIGRKAAKGGRTSAGGVVGEARPVSPRRVTNPKHHPRSNSPEPRNVDELYQNSVVDDRGRRWAIDDDGVIHRFAAPSNGETHWNGSTAPTRGKKNLAIDRADIPNEIIKKLEARH